MHEIVPVFPLPNIVFFPRTWLPLHIFEPRYRHMVRDVTAGDGRIVVSRRVGEDFESLATVGRVGDLEPLPDGRFNLRLEGLRRVAISEVLCDTPYRQVRIEPRPERLGVEDPSRLEKAKLGLLASLGVLLSASRQPAPILLDQGVPFEVAVNQACSVLPMDPDMRQMLLADDDLLTRHQRVSRHLADIIEMVAQLGTASPGGTQSIH
jgi:Lon protease-like protein